MRLLSDACRSPSTTTAPSGIEPNRERIAENLDAEPHAGHGARPATSATTSAAAIAKKAHHDGSTLREAAVASGHVTDEDYDRWVDPAAMTRPDPPA